MAYMNSVIKAAVLLFNVYLWACGMFIFILSALIYDGNVWPEFDRDVYEDWCILGFLFGSTIVVVTVLGCFGSANQVHRTGFCPGRCALGYYQLLLMGFVVVCILMSIFARNTLDSIEYSLENDGSTDYDSFESEISTRFNSNYFNALCSVSPSESWFLEWSQDLCPDTMSRTTCALSFAESRNCDTTCQTFPFNPSSCCPDEDLCSSGMIAACPYEQCRLETLQWTADRFAPMVSFLELMAFVSGGMVFLTCLLICYNPKDSVHEELIKTGVLVQVYPARDPKDRNSRVRSVGRTSHNSPRNNQRGPGRASTSTSASSSPKHANGNGTAVRQNVKRGQSPAQSPRGGRGDSRV